MLPIPINFGSGVLNSSAETGILPLLASNQNELNTKENATYHRLRCLRIDVSPSKAAFKRAGRDQMFRGPQAKRVQTVFDVICRLSEDGIAAAKNQDM
jgi:hypothetical protein